MVEDTPETHTLDRVIEDKFRKAEELREQGNAAFRSGDLKTAAIKYHEIYFYINGLDKGITSVLGFNGNGTTTTTKEGEEEEEGKDHKERETGEGEENGAQGRGKSNQLHQRVQEFTYIHHINLAAVLLKQEKYERCITNCTKALEIKPDNPKALFRRGKAYLLLWPNRDKLDQAKADLQGCIRADPSNREARSLLMELKDKYKQINEEQKKKLSGFLSR